MLKIRSSSHSMLMIYGFLLISVTGDGCPYKECDCSGTYIECQQRGLTAMPIYYSVADPTFLTLTLDSNQITEISAGSLPTGLIEISMIDNPITIIDDNAFDAVSSTLESLYFTHAGFVRIPDAFLHLNTLKHLNIMYTNIVDWNIGAMAHISQTMETLNLENVGFTKWPVWIQFFSHLNELNIAGSSIATIPDDAFDILANSLMTLTFYNNSLTSTPKSLSKLTNLITLDLQGNKLSNLTWLPASSRLYELSLTNNSISDANHLSNSLRVYADSLASLTLSNNQLTLIPDLSFMTKINSLDLSHNHISDPNSGSTPAGIYDLKLSFNLLPSVPKIFMTLKILLNIQLSNNVIRELHGTDIPLWVRDLDLGYNLIVELTDTSFPKNSSIEGLSLNNNPLATISSLAFKNLQALTSLNLKETKLARLPLSLSYLTQLYILDMSDCHDLVCTCLEKSLAPRLTSDIELFGNCGLISIYNFLATLSLTCP